MHSRPQFFTREPEKRTLRTSETTRIAFYCSRCAQQLRPQLLQGIVLKYLAWADPQQHEILSSHEHVQSCHHMNMYNRAM